MTIEGEAAGIRVAPDVRLGRNVTIHPYVNLYGCEVGDETKIGCFVEIQKGAKVGARCKISSHTFICEGVTLEDGVFIGHGVIFTNDRWPRALNAEGNLRTDSQWTCLPTRVKRGASVGSGCTLLGGITIGENAMIGAGSVVTADVLPGKSVAGNPAREILTYSEPVHEVPFLDLQAHHAPLRTEIRAAIEAVIDSGHFAGGPFVERFETDFAAYCGARHAVGVGSGTDAIWLSLMASGIGLGDEVITVPMSFFATAEAISFTGATPIFVDIDAASYTMDPARLITALSHRTKAIIPVHLFGQTADMDPILDFAEKHGLLVIEDAAQAHGAQYKGRRAGSLGDAGCFSFYPGKNLGGAGEAGAVVTNDDEMARKLRILRDHGQARKHWHSVIGWNSRMDGIQASVLSLKLRHLDRNNRRRRAHASHYDKCLSNTEGVVVPACGSHSKPVHHIYAIQVDDRQGVINHLNRKEIGYGLHYPVPIHLQPAYATLGHRIGDFPVSERNAERLISLPIFPEISFDQVDAVVNAVRQFSSALLSA